jgi:ribosomal-protein-alanine N-acetyltransferase
VSFELRLAEARDDDFVTRLAERVGLAVDGSAERSRPFARLWIVVDRTDPGVAACVGFVLLWLVADEAEVIDVAVLPERAGRGIGRRLLGGALAEAKKEGARIAFLEVRRENARAQALYAALGFEKVGERSRYYSNGEDALLFRCCLDGAD